MSVNRERMTRDNRLISIQLEQCANRALAQEGLTSVQAQILLHILRHSEKGTSLTAIHRESGYSMAAISSLIKRLREKGYVRVEPLAGDDRCKLLFGTDKGKQVQTFLDASMRKTQDCLFQGFSQEDLDTLDRLQKKMLANLSVYDQHELREVSER